MYFTYADLRCRHWISATELAEKPPEPFMGAVIQTRRKDGSVYFREVLPFSCWSVKSEASIKNDHGAKFLDRDNAAEREAFLDFASFEQWGESKDGTFALPPRAEYREPNGGYGRGYRPYYLSPSDWLVIDGQEISVKPDAEFQKARQL